MSTEIEEKSKRRRRQQADGDDAEEIVESTDEFRETERKGRATPSARRRRGAGADDRGNFLTRMFRGVRGYLAGVRDELDKVVWPTREELIRLSRIVSAVVVVSAIALYAVSYVYNQLFVVGINQDHPEIFVAFFGLVAAGVYYYSRRSKTDATL